MDGGVRLCLALSGVAAAVLAGAASPASALAGRSADRPTPAHATTHGKQHTEADSRAPGARSLQDAVPAATSHARRDGGAGSNGPATTRTAAVLAASTPGPAGEPAAPPVIAVPPTAPKPPPVAVPGVPAGARVTWILVVVVVALALAVVAAVGVATRWGRSRH